jgi:hypothetical protein
MGRISRFIMVRYHELIPHKAGGVIPVFGTSAKSGQVFLYALRIMFW